MKRLILVGLLLGLTLPVSAQLAFSPGTLATVVASPPAGGYGSTQTVTLSDPTSTNAFICYTTDSSTPTGTTTSCTNGTHYTVGISVSTNTTIKAAAFQGYYRASPILTAVYTISATPTANTSNIATVSSNSTVTTTFTAPSGTFGLIAHLFNSSAGAAITSIKDCAGSSACSGTSTDTFVLNGPACTVGLNGATQCEYYICQSALASGASAVTLVWSNTPSFNDLEIEAITGMLTSSCADTNGTNSGSTGSPTATTSGNIGHGGELVIAYTIAGVAPTAGSGYTAVQLNGGFGTESSNTAPSSGATATATFTTTSTNWGEMISAWRSQ